MFHPINRRRFVTTASASALAGLGDFSFLGALPELRGAGPLQRVRLASVAADIEPLVRLIEDSPRQALLERVLDKIRDGTSYQELLSAVFLAGVRGIQPRPVGFKFHAVLVINSAHQASLAARDQDRWLPLLWSIDYFKSAQADNAKQGDWRMPEAEEMRLPEPRHARAAFVRALEDWDVQAADRTVVAFARTAGAAEVFEPMWLYSARDFRDIGHKIIFAANAWRTLQAIGWRHNEPVVRSLAYALQYYTGGNPAKRDDPADRPGRENLKRAAKFAAFRHAGRRDNQATNDVVATLRRADADGISRQVEELLGKGVHPESIWNGLFLSAGELLMRQPGIVSLHSLTSLNAFRFAYETTGVPTTRAFLLLQAAAFLPLFRAFMESREKMTDRRIDRIEPLDAKGGVAEILADVSRNKERAARKTLSLLQSDPQQTRTLIDGARRLIFAKGTNTHDYKFSAAVMEDAYHLPVELRPAYLAASVFWLRGSGDEDNDLIRRARTALARG